METLGERIARARAKRGMSQSALARKVGVKPQSIQAIESNKAKGSKHVIAIARALNIPPEFLENGTGWSEDGDEPPSPPVAPEVGDAIPEIDVKGGAGFGGEAMLVNITSAEGETTSADAVKGNWHFPPDYLSEMRVRAKRVRIIEIFGDSMRRPDGAGLHSGDRVMVDLEDVNPTPPGIFALWDGFGIVVKRLERVMRSDPPAVHVISDNPSHPPTILTQDEVNIVGRVIWFARRM